MILVASQVLVQYCFSSGVGMLSEFSTSGEPIYRYRNPPLVKILRKADVSVWGCVRRRWELANIFATRS